MKRLIFFLKSKTSVNWSPIMKFIISHDLIIEKEYFYQNQFLEDQNVNLVSSFHSFIHSFMHSLLSLKTY